MDTTKTAEDRFAKGLRRAHRIIYPTTPPQKQRGSKVRLKDLCPCDKQTGKMFKDCCWSGIGTDVGQRIKRRRVEDG